MAASYPSAIKTWPQLEDGVDTIFALHPNERGDEITAIETELGLLPKGPDSTVLARLDRGPVIPLTNKSGGALAAGDVVHQDTGNDEGVDDTTTIGSTRPVFVARATIANDAVGYFQQTGKVTVKVQGTVAKGDFLRTSATTTRAESAGTNFVAGVFGKALTANASGAGTVTAVLFGITVNSLALAAWEQVESITPGAVTNVTSATLPTDSDLFMVVLEGILAASGATLGLQPNGDTDADKEAISINGTTITNVTGATSIKLGSADANDPLNGHIYVPRICASTDFQFPMSTASIDHGGTAAKEVMLSGRWTTGATITTLKFVLGAVNFAAGKIHIYKSIPS